MSEETTTNVHIKFWKKHRYLKVIFMIVCLIPVALFIAIQEFFKTIFDKRYYEIMFQDFQKKEEES